MKAVEVDRYRIGEPNHCFSTTSSRMLFEVFTITGSGVDLKKATIVPAWFDKVLNDKTKEGLSVRKAAIVFIDCDIYESTVHVLDVITDFVVDGTVIMFDAWFTFRGDPGRGEQRAFREWLTKHPSITAMEWQKVNWKTNSFIIHKR